MLLIIFFFLNKRSSVYSWLLKTLWYGGWESRWDCWEFQVWDGKRLHQQILIKTCNLGIQKELCKQMLGTMKNCFTIENSKAKLCYSHKLLFQNEEGLRCSPNSLPVGSWQLSKTLAEKGFALGLGWPSSRLRWGVSFLFFLFSVCVLRVGT